MKLWLGPSCGAMSSCLSARALLSQYKELDCEENKLEVKLCDKQEPPTPKEMVN